MPPVATRTIRVGLVEDNEDLREDLVRALADTTDLAMAGNWRTAEEAIAALPGIRPDVVLLDIQLPGISGLDCLCRLKPEMPDTEFMMFTVVHDQDRILEALKAGATGYLLKGQSTQGILDAIRDLHRGGSPMTPDIARRVLGDFRQLLEWRYGTTEALTLREEEVLRLISSGRRAKEAADELGLATDTIRAHLRNIYKKLQVNSKAAAVRRFREREANGGR
jgi:DNA-binding NarL/FixJ family response regulator